MIVHLCVQLHARVYTLATRYSNTYLLVNELCTVCTVSVYYLPMVLSVAYNKFVDKAVTCLIYNKHFHCRFVIMHSLV